jgi:hypothetical protein
MTGYHCDATTAFADRAVPPAVRPRLVTVDLGAIGLVTSGAL